MTIFASALTRAVAAALALAAPAAALQAQGPAGNLRPSEPAAIVAAAQSCQAAVTPERLDEARLTADGWTGGEVRSSGGERVDTSLRIFSRDNVLIFATPDSPACVLMARLRNMRAFPQVSQAFATAYGPPSQVEQNGTQMWLLPEGKAMLLEATGTRERPNVRVAIMHGGRESK